MEEDENLGIPARLAGSVKRERLVLVSFFFVYDSRFVVESKAQTEKEREREREREEKMRVV